ncbi:YbhB/YbcL family Raf kinase inhibitor-like protein [soil metagenome]
MITLGYMRLTSPGFEAGQPIPAEHAFAVPHPNDHIEFAPNRNPAFVWDEVPEQAQSFVLLCIDSDVPSVADDVNQEGREVPPGLVRTQFAHWVLVDLPASRRSIAVAEFSDGVTPRGKEGARGFPAEGVNDFTSWFTGDLDMEGTYRGYDGPCPPWNDSLVHHYTFTLFALDVDTLNLAGAFSADDAVAAMEGHVLEEATIQGTYTLNPRLR